MIERTLVLIQKDAMAKNLAGEIISRLEKAGFVVKALKMVRPSEEMARRHYTTSDEQIVGMGNKTLKAAKESGREGEIMRIFETEDPKKIGKVLHSWLIDFITEKPVLAIIFEGEDAIKSVRAIVGYTDPTKAEKGTIRGDLGSDSIEKANKEMRKVENLIHASDSPESSEREIAVWFEKNEIHK